MKQAVEESLARMFSRFPDADQQGWETVTRRVSEGGPDPLSALGFTGEVDRHPVCQEVRNFVGNNANKGTEVRRHFSGSPYGWPQDAVDGALLALLAGGFLKASRNGPNCHSDRHEPPTDRRHRLRQRRSNRIHYSEESQSGNWGRPWGYPCKTERSLKQCPVS